MNTTGNNFRLTTFGESHGSAVGGIVDGMPPMVRLDMDRIMAMIDRRRTGRDPLTSARREADVPEILSGVTPDGVTLGTPIGFIFRNSDARSADYGDLKERYRPNHADYTYDCRYGIRDYRGGGRASARETVSRVMGGALAMEWLRGFGITIEAKVTRVGTVGYDDIAATMSRAGCGAQLPDDDAVETAMRDCVDRARRDLDSVGGAVTCLVRNLPAGIGAPVFGKLHATLAAGIMSINAAKGFEYGIGSKCSSLRGSEMLDLFNPGFSPAPVSTNYSGGVQGGISNGMPLFFTVSFKPTPTISRPVEMPDAGGELKEVAATGRHDPCVALRAPVIVEAMTALAVADALLDPVFMLTHKDLY